MLMRLPAQMSLLGGDRHHAAMRDVTYNMLELNRRMEDFELAAQPLIYIAEDPLTRGRWDVIDADVAGERVNLRADTPDVQVMHVPYPGNPGNLVCYLVHPEPTRHAFEKDVQGLANDAEGRPQNQSSDRKREHWINPVLTGDVNRYATDD